MLHTSNLKIKFHITFFLSQVVMTQLQHVDEIITFMQQSPINQRAIYQHIDETKFPMQLYIKMMRLCDTLYVLVMLVEIIHSMGHLLMSARIK